MNHLNLKNTLLYYLKEEVFHIASDDWFIYKNTIRQTGINALRWERGKLKDYYKYFI